MKISFKSALRINLHMRFAKLGPACREKQIERLRCILSGKIIKCGQWRYHMFDFISLFSFAHHPESNGMQIR